MYNSHFFRNFATDSEDFYNTQYKRFSNYGKVRFDTVRHHW